MARQLVLQKTIPVPNASYTGKRRRYDFPFLYADERTLILTYRGVPHGQRGLPFDRMIMVQALLYQRVRFTPAKTAQAQPTVVLERKGARMNLRIRFQAATFEATAKEFRCYALIDNEDYKQEEVSIYPDDLIGKREYFERQLAGQPHFPVWDKLLAKGRTREDLWLELQEKYLFRFRKFLRVECDWGGTGIWGISFPGSYGATPNYAYECFDLPKQLIRRFERWTKHYNSMDPSVSFDEQGFRQEWFDKEGAALACELASRVDTLTYVEYSPFKQAKPKAATEQQRKASAPNF